MDQISIRGIASIAIIASRDIPYCLDHSTIWLDPYKRSLAVNDTAWRGLLNGADLLPPAKVETFVDASIGIQREQTAW